MEKEKSEKLITDAAKTIFSYCRARTNSKEEAEDLSQDIILELLRTRENLRDDKAFYGFMWAVAGNVYKNWCKKRAKNIQCELDESVLDNNIPLDELLEKESDLSLLHRELGLLTEQYRKVVVMYYFNELKVSDISKSLNISESMVKFLLFKSRKILKEGMNMEKTRGDLSFNPGKLSLNILGLGAPDKQEERHALFSLFDGSLIAQNILLACYNDRCTEEEISLQIGIAVPYLEMDLKKLCERKLLLQKGAKYETNIVIFTKEFSEEEYEKTLPAQRKIADIIEKCFTERIDDIKTIGFHRGTYNNNLLKWLITSMIFAKSRPEIWKKQTGIEVIIWAVERWSNSCGFANIFQGNADGVIHCADFPATGAAENVCDYFERQNRVNIILNIAKGKIDRFSENDMVEVEDMIKHNYIRRDGYKLISLLPVFTQEQFKQFKIMNEDIINEFTDKTCEIIGIFADILLQHAPISLKKEIEHIKWVKARDCIAIPIKIMMDNGTLQRVSENAHPASYIFLA